MIVDWRRGRLHEEDLLAANRVEKLHRNVTVRITIDDAGADLRAELTRYRRGQSRVGAAAENRELVSHVTLRPSGNHPAAIARL